MFPIKVRGRRFDARHGVRTAGVVDFEDLDMKGLNIEHSNDYEAIDPKLFRKALHALKINYEDFIFVDFGSGMGRAVLLASEFPFRAVLGVEFSPELHRIAEDNIRRYQKGSRKCGDVKSVCMDALEYAVPDNPAVLFFYNPFKEQLLASVLENIRRSLEQNPREIRVIYVHPKLSHLMDSDDTLTRIDSGKVTAVSYIIYRNNGSIRSSAPSAREARADRTGAVFADRPAIVEQGVVHG